MAERALRRVFLVGPMGSGKTSLGRRAAEQLGLTFIDCDEEIERRTGASVNLIFDIEGEEGFRRRESDMLAELAGREGTLIATGGGVVLREKNRRVLGRSGRVVWLKTPVSQQVQRLEMDKKRPLLQTENWQERLVVLAAERDPLYEKVADLEFESGGRSVAVAARRLLDLLEDTWGLEAVNHAHH